MCKIPFIDLDANGEIDPSDIAILTPTAQSIVNL